MTQPTLDPPVATREAAPEVDLAGSASGKDPSRPGTPHVVGIDPSLTATGLACPHGSETRGDDGHDGDTLEQRAHRIHQLRNEVLDWCRNTDLVVIEGPAFGSRFGHAHDRSGLWWLVVDRLIANRIPVAVVTPTGLKKYATGNGRASKPEVLLAAVRRLPQFDVHNDNEADAAWLVAMGLDHLGHPIVAMPAAHRVALTSVAWPEVSSR